MSPSAVTEGADAAPRHELQCNFGKSAGRKRKCPAVRSYWDWQEMLNQNQQRIFPYTPPTNLMYGLREAPQHDAGRRARTMFSAS